MPVTVGIDIGGTGTKLGLVTDEGDIISRVEFNTWDFPKFNEYVGELARSINSLLKSGNQGEPVGIGICAPMGNYFKGTIDKGYNLPWQGVLPLRDQLQGALGIPTIISNDANAAALGEKVFGVAKDLNDFVMITLGTGLGSGFISNGKLVLGFEGFAGELGHVNGKKPSGRLCNCGKKGCLETYVSATGIKRTIFSLLADSHEGSYFRTVSFDDLSTKEITEAAEEGDKIALEAFEYTGEIFGGKLAEVAILFNPEAIILAGGLSKAGHFIIDPTKRHMEDNLMDAYKGKIRFLSSQLGSEGAAILGAASLVRTLNAELI